MDETSKRSFIAPRRVVLSETVPALFSMAGALLCGVSRLTIVDNYAQTHPLEPVVSSSANSMFLAASVLIVGTSLFCTNLFKPGVFRPQDLFKSLAGRRGGCP